MLESEIQGLAARDNQTDLGRLESDIWAREANILRDRGAMRRLMSWQALVMALAVVGSAGAASSVAMHRPSAQAPAGLLGADSLAPSFLLFGGRR